MEIEVSKSVKGKFFFREGLELFADEDEDEDEEGEEEEEAPLDLLELNEHDDEKGRDDCQPESVSNAARAQRSGSRKLSDQNSRAGRFRYFLIFSIIKNDFFAFFIKLITCFCTSPN